MNCADCSTRLHDYVDGELASAERRDFEAHVTGCSSCRAQLESLRALLAETSNLSKAMPPPRDLWAEIQGSLAERERQARASSRGTRSSRSRPDRVPPDISFWRWLAPLAVAASIALLATFAERRLVPRTPAWSVAAVAGAPRLGSQTFRDEAQFRLGQWLETDASSRAKVAVGQIGEVNVEPNSRLRLVGMAETDHRLELARGTLSAFIFAPPRIFFVNTPSATAVDLGCAYTLTVNDAGDGELHVTSGYVALENHGRDSIIRMGMMCLTRRGVGPGTPFAVDAPESLRAALTRFDQSQLARPRASGRRRYTLASPLPHGRQPARRRV
jgi:anti-sigma factor RsiW